MRYQGPKGTRDFYPQEMALRRYLEKHWRDASIRSGFEEMEGPIFESLDLYQVKSGEGIISELFHFRDRGDRELAIRPEFTPTLARMVAAKANSLSKPIKWFCIPNLCRAERPQRGRLREFLQWNVDMLGTESMVADAEVIFTAVDGLRALGLKPQDIRIKISHRETVQRILLKIGIEESRTEEACVLLDKRDRMEPAAFEEATKKAGLEALASFDAASHEKYDLDEIDRLQERLDGFQIAPWCEVDLGIVRGLAYYTGMVFEIHEASGAERAIAGGGRYDNLIESFGGPPTPAVGFGMGDVVLTLVLQDRGLIPDALGTTADVFLLTAKEESRDLVYSTAAKLRSAGIHARYSYRSTTNVGKLLKEADQNRASFAVIFGESREQVDVKNLQSGEQSPVSLPQLVEHITQQLKK